LNQWPVLSPVPAPFKREREAVAPFDPWMLLRIKAFVDDDFAALQPDRAEYVLLATKEATARNPQQAVQVIELDPKLEVLFDDVLDGDGAFTSSPVACAYCASNASASRSMVSSEM
jgi:hypothetical protein